MIETCCNWSTEWNRCDSLKVKCDGHKPLDGSRCRFYKTIAKKKEDDKRTSERLKLKGQVEVEGRTDR